MQNNIFVFVVCFLTYFRTASTDSETVWLKDVTIRIHRHKRSLGDPDLPDKLSFLLKRKLQTLPINLKRNYNIDPNADIYTVRKLNDGRSILEKNNVENEDMAYYHDRENGAFMTARCVKRSNEQCDIVITGNIRIGNQNYDLRPAENDFPSRNVLYIADPGKRYLLQNQLNIARDMPVEQNQLNIDRNQLLIQDKTETDINIERKDNKKKEYHVKVLVILDSSVWDLFISLVNSSLHISKRVPKTQKNIRRYYSHIMNGVHQLYQGIEDPDIDINVKISGFVYLEWEAHFRHKISQVLNVNGEKMINSSLYLADLYYADRQGRYNHLPEFDQIILFTRYSFLRRDTDTSYAGGLSFPGYVCVPGYRVEIVESTEYFRTTYIAAHELGHSLGAIHDGEGEAISCKAEEGYIMTPGMPVFDPQKSYSKNPWLFSTCSVEAFKKTLTNKDCVTKKPVYDQTEIDEWNKFMKKLPGQKYTCSEQCELTFGRGYAYCEGQHENICRFMYCMDTKTSICMTIPVSAAPGTTCGTNKWCQQGLCVEI